MLSRICIKSELARVLGVELLLPIYADWMNEWMALETGTKQAPAIAGACRLGISFSVVLSNNFMLGLYYLGSPLHTE